MLTVVPGDGSGHGNGRRLVLRNGYHPSREVLTTVGAIEVTVHAPHLVALVPAGARFERGLLVERPEAVAA